MTTPKPESVTWKWIAGIAVLLIGSMLSVGVMLLVGSIDALRRDMNTTMTDVAVIKATLEIRSAHTDATAKHDGVVQ